MNTKPIIVCHIVNSLDTGGMENGVINLCNMIDRDQFKPIICCLKEKGTMATRLKSDVDIYNIQINQNNKIAAIYKVARHIKKLSVQIVHTHAWGSGSLYGILGAKLAHVPVIINGEHGAFFDTWYQILIQKLLFKICDANLAVSESLKNSVSKTIGVPHHKIIVVKNGVDTDIFSGDYSRSKVINGLLEEGYALEERSILIMNIGSLKPQKSQMMLVNAIKNIIRDRKELDIHVFFIGDGQDRSYLDKYVHQEGLQKSIHFLGNRSDIPELLSICDIFVSTSIPDFEGLSNVILEAMSSGVPVISTRSVGSSELVLSNTNGILVNHNDIDQLENAIRKMIDDEKLREEMGNNGRKIISQDYSINEMIMYYEKIYRRILEQRMASAK